VDISPRVWQGRKLAISKIFKKYLQCMLAAKILTVDFVVCNLAIKKKSGHVSTCWIGPFPCELYSVTSYSHLTQKKLKGRGNLCVKEGLIQHSAMDIMW
jgi:hypothetical protein